MLNEQFRTTVLNHGVNEHVSAISTVPQEIYYHIPWRARGVQAGSHKTNMRGAGSDFASFVSLLDCPDPKRLDVRASLRSFPRQLMVRTFFERSAIKVYVINDLSSSMRFSGSVNKASILAEIVETIAWSVVRQGDTFGMVSCDDSVLETVSIMPTNRKSAAQEARQQLVNFFAQAELSTHTAQAIPQAVKNISTQKSLVFIISDFHWPEALLKQTFQAYPQHAVMPIVLWDETEFEVLPTWGWAKVREMETGLQQSLFMRPALHKSIHEYAKNRKNMLGKMAQQFGARWPFFVNSRFDATAFTHHLMGA